MNDKQGTVEYQQLQLHGVGCSIRFASTKSFGESRQWLFNSSGRVGSFITSQGGRNSKSTGVRAYYLIPSEESYFLDGTKPIQAGSAENTQFRVHMAGEIWSLDKKSGALVAPSGCKSTIGPIPGSIKGGFELESCKNKIVLDVGWSVGKDPERNSQASSVLRDANGHSCTVQNSKLFKYSGDEYSLRFTTADEWSRFLETTSLCKGLNLAWKRSTPSSHSALPGGQP